MRYEDIDDFSRDTRSALAYGGWGYRFALTKDGWVKAYISSANRKSISS